MDGVWEALARLEAVRRAARVQAALFNLGASQLRAQASNPDAILDTAANVAEARDASLHAAECAVQLEQSRREYVDAGIPADQLDVPTLQAWAQEHWKASSDPNVALLLHWLRSPWDDAQDLAVTIVQMIGRVNAGKSQTDG